MSNMLKPDIEAKLRKMTGKDRAAILMLSLPERITTELLSALDPHEIKEISMAMLKVKKADPEIIKAITQLFIFDLTGQRGMIGTVDGVRRLLSSFLSPEQADGILDEINGLVGRTVWDKLGNVHDESLANYLINEYPQTVAVVLTKIPAKSAAKVLARLPHEFSHDILNRMLDIDLVKKEIVEDIELNLKTDFMSRLSKPYKRDPFMNVAEIFNFMDQPSENRLLDSIEGEDADRAERIRSLMFTFKDLKKMDTQSFQRLARAIDKADLSVALKGADEDMKDLFFNTMTERAKKLMKEEIDQMGPVRVKQVEEAQMNIITKAKKLAEENMIFLPNQGGGDISDLLI
ncbi:MAG: flagellar motor switch protein FliG [Alphaproteobacteria bacterium]|nr:flagellar motor switch protein FliG [Alphaproteobacteria bacterium]